MTATCEVCRAKPANTHDFALRGGRWVPAELCADCVKRRRRAPLTVLGAAAAAAALVGGAAIAFDTYSRRQQSGSEPSPPASPSLGTSLGRVFSGGSSTLAQYSLSLIHI